ncbi:MAG: 4-phosphoerythronate dehydrogenase [Paludibacteraceae bacterium]|nr:4-phosphoerythronate dehydrogenase [Paludibacteraceae bacterium]
MLIVADAHIPFLTEAVQREWPDVDICPMKPEGIDNRTVRNADILIVRTRTKVNESLLADSNVKMVCTATIGYDHVDTAYCEAHGIRWMSCPGCNAQAVCDYIEEAIEETIGHWSLGIGHSILTIGIVGVGHVGSKVAQMAEQKGYKVLLNDPPKRIGVSLDFIAQKCDIITFHVPLDISTHHLCDEAFLAKCKPDALIINAARGGVVDEQALLPSGHPYILDTWENEPVINREVLQNAFLASMHIAGYSLEGKRNASQMCLDGIAETFSLPKINILQSSIANHHSPITRGDSSPGWLKRISDLLKTHPEQFESLRKNYPLR